MRYFAHSDKEKDKSEWHLLKTHLEGTAKLAEGFAESFGAKKLGYMAGIMHDIGKYSSEFQRRLEGDKNRVDHSTAGAFEAEKRYKSIGKILAYVIAGHHCGLPDWGSKADEASLEGRLIKGSALPDYSAHSSEVTLLNLEELNIPIKRMPVGLGFSAQFFIRFLYSSLVDADFLDTERALNVEKSSLRDNRASLAEMLLELDAALENKCRSAPDTLVNRYRAEILDSCRKKAVLEQGLFTLTVPTGGGKTLSSMAFALKHAITHGMDKVIYVIPYTSIIEQNAEEFRKIFGDDKVLEHHSNFIFPEDSSIDKESEYCSVAAEKMKLASENWDKPIIATTNVQFFESLFAARSSRCRKLHNITNSVIIIDEAQMIPTGFLKPCINALMELVANYKTTVVLCTATQPATNKFLSLDFQPVEIVDDPEELYKAMQRVKLSYLGTEPMLDEVLTEKLLSCEQILCIVNSKKHARVIYEKIQAEGSYHLSTRMCPAHRSMVLKTIKERLKNNQTCRVVSTQLIEAGVDVDFPVVYRSAAGIDSIAQAAGRCNREGRREQGEVYVFKPEKHGLPAGWLSRTASIGEGIFRRHEDPLGIDGVKDYFLELYDIEGEKLDKEMIMAEIKEQEQQLRFPFRTISDRFRLIDDKTTSIVIPWDEKCRSILDQARWSKFPGSYIRKLQRYSVQVFEQEFKEMLRFGMLEEVAGCFYVLSDDAFNTKYSKEMGVLPCTESMLLNDILII